MATDGHVNIDVKVNDKDAVKGAQNVRSSIHGIKDADAKLNWSGLKEGSAAANQASTMANAMSVALGNLAAQGMTMALSKAKELAQDVVEIGSGFETSMSKVSALSGAQGEELGALEAKARELGASTTFSASQAADALGYMALAGWDSQQMLDGVGSVLTLAQAGEMDLAAASDLVTDYLSAFGMQADETSRMVDVLAYAQANANTTVEGLGMAYKNCAANAHAAGLDVETTTSLISQMANQGLKGSEAGTALNAVMRDMTAQMEDGAIKIGETSVAIMDAEGNYRDFIDILADVQNATNGLGDAEKSAALQSTFTADSIKGLNLLLNAGADEAAAFRSELYDCAGTAEATAATMTNNLSGDVAAMGSAFEELAIKIYDELQEPLREAVQFITGTVVPGIEWMVQNLDKVAPVLAGLASGLAIVANRQKMMDAGQAIWKTLTTETTKNAAAMTKATAAVSGYGMKAKVVTTEQKAQAVAVRLSTTSIQAQTGAVKASTVAMNLLKVAGNGVRAMLMTIAPIAAMMALVEVVTAIGGALETSRKNAENYAKATDGMDEAINAGEQAFESYVPAAEAAADAIENVKISADDCIASQAELAEKTRETFADAGTDAAVVQSYADTIAELADKHDEAGNKIKLTAEEQTRLQAAVEGYNEATGEAVGITDLQNGTLTVAKDKILETAAAYKEEAMAEAAREMYKEHAKQLIQDQMALKEATDKLTAAQQECRDAEQSLTGDALTPYADAVILAQQEVDRLTAATESEESAMETLANTMASNVGTFDTLDAALDNCGLSMESFGDASEEQLAALQSGFHGSLNDIVATCASQGLEIPSALANAIMANSGLPQEQQQAMLDALVLKMTGGDVEAAAQVLGRDIDQGLVDGITGSGDLPAAAIGLLSDDVINKAKEQFDSHSPSRVMMQLGTDVDAGLAQGIEGGTDGPVGAMASLGQSVIDALAGLPENLTGTGESAGSRLADGISTGQGSASAAASNLSTVAADRFSSASGDAWWAGYNMAATSFGPGVASGRDAAVAEADIASKHVADHLSSSNGDAWWAGYNMALGLAQGIAAGRSEAVNAARDLASEAVQAAMDVAEIASPSKVMKRIGRWYSEGLAIGIEEDAPLARAAAQDAMGGAIKGASVPQGAPLDINWYAKAGRYAGLSALGIDDATQVTAPRPSAGTPSAASVKESSSDIQVTIVIEQFTHSGSEMDDEALLRRIAQKVGEQMRGRGVRW